MSRISRLIVVCVTVAGLAVPVGTYAAPNVVVSCNVSVDCLHNGALVESYENNFLVEQGVGFIDDFSTATRFKRFTASVVRDGGTAIVSIDYFNDVGVFHSIGFNTSLTLHSGGAVELTSGSNGFLPLPEYRRAAWPGTM